MMIDPLATPRRIAFAGDWHMNHHWARKAISHAEEQGADVIIHLGDFGYTFEERYLEAVEDALWLWEIPLLFIDGNHECFPKLHNWLIQPNGLRQLRPRIFHLSRGFRWEWDGVRFLALGGAHSVDRGSRRPHVEWWPEETINANEARRAFQAGRADVMVTHDCPDGVPELDRHLERTAGYWPPDEVARAEGHRRLLGGVVSMVQPSHLWHGHYHYHYSTVVDGMKVTGLNMDETTLSENVQVVDLESLK